MDTNMKDVVLIAGWPQLQALPLLLLWHRDTGWAAAGQVLYGEFCGSFTEF